MDFRLQIPWKRISIQSPLAVEESCRLLKEKVNEESFLRGLFWPSRGRALRGRIRGARFVITRNDSFYRGTVIIVGRIHSDNKGTRVAATLRLDFFSYAFLAAWVPLTVYVTGIGIVDLVRYGRIGILLFGIGGLGAVSALFLFGFTSEADKAERLLRGVFVPALARQRETQPLLENHR